MRAKIHWFRAAAAKSPAEVAGALAFIAWGIARRMLASLRKADFDVNPGPQYFEFLSEALAFEIQVAWRVAYDRFPDADRVAFANALAHGVASILADNQAELLGAQPADEIEAQFIARLNVRFEEYAEFAHGPGGPDFAFLRYFACLARDLMPDKDRAWIHDQVIAIEGPEAAQMIARSVAGLLDTGPQRAGHAPRAGVGE